jgi:acetyltransferase
MINQQLINPKSIVVVGGSDDIQKPGGKVLKNLIDGSFNGSLYVVNPKANSVQGVSAVSSISELPDVDLAILAIAAKYCPDAVRELAESKSTKAFIILSAGFHEENEEGALLEQEIVDIVNTHNACLIGPNCIGVMNANYQGVFTAPIPKFDSMGIDFISGSGATAVFIMESGIPNGLTFSSVYSVGNSAQMGVEDVLKYLDESYVEGESSKVKLIYIESINKPDMLLKHASSLISKGCRIAAIKSGSSEAGSRAASSHTGALASPDIAVNALFKKAGIVRCSGRSELATIAGIFTYPELKGNNIAVVTHAGGPAVMLTDALSNNGLNVPPITCEKSKLLLEKLYGGSSVSNPIDFLATGTAEQLASIIDACENDFNEIDAMAIIFGSPGLSPVYDAYEVIDAKMKVCKKPIYPVLPSIVNVKNEIEAFLAKGRVNFPDEVTFGNALAKVYHTPKPVMGNVSENRPFSIDRAAIRKVVDGADNGYLAPEKVQELLDAAGINRAKEMVVSTPNECVAALGEIGFPIVMKVVGPVHKSDVGGVVLNVKSEEVALAEFDRMMKIKDTTAILLQPMLTGTQLFVGAKQEGDFGHLIFCGLGGIFIEVLKDVAYGLTPLAPHEATEMVHSLKSYKIIQGVRGQDSVNEEQYVEIIQRVSALCEVAPEIFEMDINPLLGTAEKVVAVDARIRIEK